MPSIVYLDDMEASPMARALVQAGFQVHDAVSVIGALLLARREDVGAVIIAPGFVDPALRELRRRIKTLELTEESRPAEVIWELAGTFSKSSTFILQ
jgi:hypothetical protein